MDFVSRLFVATRVMACLVVTVTAAVAQTAATYPERTIRLVVPYAPGGSSDFTGRLIAQKMSEGLKQPIIVDNRPGANGTIGADAVAKAAPDGYTLLLAPREMGINPSIYAKLPYETLKNFAWIGMATEGHFVLVVNPTVPAKTLAEFIALAKSKPGSLAYGSIGQGSVSHLNMEALKQQQAIDLLHVPYKGAGPALTATVSGEVAATIAAVPGAIGFIRDGRLRALAVGSQVRLPQLPDVPTSGEAGGGAETFLPTFFGLAAPAGTPAPIIAKLNAELNRVVQLPEIVEKLNASGMMAVRTTPEAFGQVIAKDVERFGALVKSIGIQPE
jgi:tripartite-type tricarboxylate transporter receptor subunit TctC